MTGELDSLLEATNVMLESAEIPIRPRTLAPPPELPVFGRDESTLKLATRLLFGTCVVASDPDLSVGVHQLTPAASLRAVIMP